MRWILSLAILAAGVYFLVQRWPSTPTSWAGMIPHWTGSVPVEVWKARTVAGLKVELPCEVEYYKPTGAPAPAPNIFQEDYRGKAGDHVVYVTHITSPALARGPTLTLADKALVAASARSKMKVISINPATTIINGLRACRSDFISTSKTPQIRDRCVVLEGGTHLWVLEYQAPENDSGAEQAFLRMAKSAGAR
jgi:hypothetical protein